ncbi:hypothetical protein ACFVR2_07475 [Gottfriedia sp. NPDC057991]|uniref:hypothetical protein n=1 Tax=Gottfriedia sp. NPDC057991 TaxID=3346298 RepID=UPI0036DBA88A
MLFSFLVFSIELENHEVEYISHAIIVFSQEQIHENIIETCVEYFKIEGSNEILKIEDTMQKVFDNLKQKGPIPKQVMDFSFIMPFCERIKRNNDYKNDVC